MAAKKGRDLLLKLASAADPQQFLTVAGLRTKRLAFNAESVDVTDSESAGRWRELLAGGGVLRASLSGSGIFKDAQSDTEIRSVFFAGDVRAWQAVIPDFGTIEGPFQVVSLDYTGARDGEVTFEVALESAGAISFGAP